MVAARRLQEAGALGDPEEVYTPSSTRLELISREVMRGINASGGDAETASVDARGSLGRYLDVLPTAEDAIDYFMSTSAHAKYFSCNIHLQLYYSTSYMYCTLAFLKQLCHRFKVPAPTNS